MSRFVVLEGPEGSGKTTQIHLLYRYLQDKGHAVICTREPGGTAIGELIRELLHDPAHRAMRPMTEVLLYSAARAQHVEEVIRPTLREGTIVLSDRFAASTIAYQGYGRGLELAMLETLTRMATGGLAPDLTIYLDLDVEVGLERKRRDQQEGRGEWNRMDQQELAFHRRVREGYLRMAAQDASRWMVVDAMQPIDAIHARIAARVEAL